MLKEEMMSSMLELQKKDIAQMFEKQQENRWNNENENGDNGMILNELNEEYEDDEEQNQNPNINENENENDNENEEQQLQQLQEEEMNTDDNDHNNNDEEGNNNNKPPRKARASKIFHELTETDWPLEQLTKLKDDMMNELAEMRKQELQKYFDNQESR